MVSALVLASGLPAVAAPTEAKGGPPVPVNCTLMLAVVNPGTSSVVRNVVRTSGEMTSGALDCDVDALDGGFSTVHSSVIRVSPDGRFQGRLKGTFSITTPAGSLTGELQAEISGVPVGFADSPPFPLGTPIYQVADVGRWEVTGGALRGQGNLSITLVGVLGVPAGQGGLSGGGVLSGKVETGS
ncbi:MAG: hypothetical protein HY686_03025 [Chloroflexi bacterium]|nr:hypothetical protein [Chloroflexota bacterium]